jgi:hypothetical protein
MTAADVLDLAAPNAGTWTVTTAHTSAEVRRFVETNHYLGPFYGRGDFIYAVLDGWTLLGAALFGRPTRDTVAPALWASGNYNNTLELTRLYTVDDPPKNLGTWFLSRAVGMLPRQFEMLVAFSDPFAHHHGGIYQASSWLYTGVTETENYHYVDRAGARIAKQTPWRLAQDQRRDGRFVDERAVDGERRIALERGWTKVTDLSKHRYVKPRTKRARRELRYPIKPYPKPGQQS